MYFKTLVKKTDHLDFAKQFSEQTKRHSSGQVKGEIPLAYMKNAKVIGLYNNKNILVAGYIINETQPLRLLTFVPDKVLPEISLPRGATLNDFCEATCAWKAPVVPGFYMTFRYWPKLWWECFLSSKKFLLGGNQSEKLDKFYLKGFAQSLYTGPSKIGLPSRLFYYNKRSLLQFILRLLLIESPKRYINYRFKRQQLK